MKSKQEIRKEIRLRREIMTKEEREEKSHRICQKIQSLPAYEEAEGICAYMALEKEVCLDELIQKALSQGKKVWIPRVEGKKMNFYPISSMEEVAIGTMGIREPVSGEPLFLPKERILFLLPAVALDEAGHRIGYGGGYYDRFLEKHPMKDLTGIVFEYQMYPQVPGEVLDISVRRILTEEKVREISEGNPEEKE